ncbi:MAG: hypothetical protein CSA72_01405 [Rhodobacterales bacterium]|nr:MAG: hypothetical protein CSA72_01405 [Rhodobacterales bacterium]
MRALLASAVMLACPAQANQLLSPPGVPELSFDLYDMRIEAGQVRFRFTYQGPEQNFDTLEPVFPWLCETIAARVLLEARLTHDHVVISVSPEPVPFGEPTEIPQFFEAFAVDGYSCKWEYF